MQMVIGFIGSLVRPLVIAQVFIKEAWRWRRSGRRARKGYFPSGPGSCEWPSLLGPYYASFCSVHITCTGFYLNGVMGALFYQSKPQILMGQQLWKGQGGQAMGGSASSAVSTLVIKGGGHRLRPDDPSCDCVGVCRQRPSMRSLQTGPPGEDDKDLQVGVTSKPASCCTVLSWFSRLLSLWGALKT